MKTKKYQKKTLYAIYIYKLTLQPPSRFSKLLMLSLDHSPEIINSQKKPMIFF